MPVVTLNYTTYRVHMHCRLPLKTFAVLYRSRTQETGSTHTEMKAKKSHFHMKTDLGLSWVSNQLTLSQPGGQITPTTVIRAPRIFRPCDGPELRIA